MEILQDRVLCNYLFDKYCSNPKNWKFLVSPSYHDDGFFDATVSNLDEVWQIKLDSLYKPSPIVIGTKIDADVNMVYQHINSAPFGYRKIDLNLVTRLLLRTENEIESEPKELSDTSLNALLSSIEPIRPSKQGSYAYGPFTFSNVSPFMKNDQQRIVGEKLSRKLKQVLKDRYSLYG
jgi:hypothetical protein